MTSAKLRDVALRLSVALAKTSRRSMAAFFNGKRARLFGMSANGLKTDKGVKQYYAKSHLRRINFNLKMKT